MKNRGIVLGLFVVLTLVAGGYVAWGHEIQPRLDAAAICSSVQENADQAPVRERAGPRRAYILGDSYTSGFTLDKPTDGFAYQLARMKGWDATVDGWAGSGYVSVGPCGSHAFGSRIDQMPDHVAVAVIEGGVNDPASGLRPVAARVIREAQQHAGRVVVLGAPPIPGRDVEAIDAALSDAADAEGAKFVPLADIDVPLGPDDTHPTARGARMLAERIAARLG